MHGTVIILTVSTALLAIGFLASTTVLFTICQLKDEKPEEENTELPDFFFPYGQSVGDSIVNGSSSKWMTDSEHSFLFFASIAVTGRLLFELDVPMGMGYLRTVDILSGGYHIDIITINVNTGSLPFEVTDPDCANTVWVRSTNSQQDLDKINCIVRNSFISLWAFVATWIDFEGSTFQVVISFDSNGFGGIIYSYGQLSQAHTGNKFAVVESSSVATHPDAGSLPINKQLAWEIVFEQKFDVNAC